MPGESLCAMNPAKWTSIVLTSADTSTRPPSADSFRTSGSGVLSGNDTHVAFKIDARFTTAQSPPDVGIKISVGLELDLQAIFGAFWLRARSNGSSISGGRGWLAWNSS